MAWYASVLQDLKIEINVCTKCCADSLHSLSSTNSLITRLGQRLRSREELRDT